MMEIKIREIVTWACIGVLAVTWCVYTFFVHRAQEEGRILSDLVPGRKYWIRVYANDRVSVEVSKLKQKTGRILIFDKHGRLDGTIVDPSNVVAPVDDSVGE